MELIELGVSIVSSVLSIVATIWALKARKQVEELSKMYRADSITISGRGNPNVVGEGNSVKVNVQ